VAPFMRGYAPTSQPADGRFDALALGEDVAALLDALGEDTVVIGHDWGAAATYFGALLASRRMRKIVTLAVPYGPGFFRALRESYVQQRRSWYMLFFQRALGEDARPGDWLGRVEALYRDGAPGRQAPAAALAAVKETLGRPGTLQAALGYYRHTMRPVFDDPAQLDGMLQAMTAP